MSIHIYAYLPLILWSPSITDDDDFLFNVEDTIWRGRIHVLTKLKVRRGCTVPSPLTWPSTKKFDGTKELATTDSMDGCNVQPETQFVGTRLRVDTTRVLSVGGNLPPCGAAGERSEFNMKPPLGAPLLIFPRGYLLKSFPRADTSARQRGFEIRVFPLLGELSKAIEPHLSVCQLYRWQLGPSMWTSPTTKSLDPIVVTALRVGFPATDPPHVDLPAIVRSQRCGQRRREGQYIYICIYILYVYTYKWEQ